MASKNIKAKEMLFSAAVDADDMSAVDVPVTEMKPWKVMVIDDDDVIHSLTHLVLEDFSYKGRKLEIIDGYSGEQACQLLTQHPDTAVLLLDVIMETDTAGLEVVDYARKNLGNKLLRIILRTGQAGQGVEEEIVKQYEINDFREKSDLTSQKLNTAIITSLRAYEEMRIIQKLANNNTGLEEMVKQQSDSEICADISEKISAADCETEDFKSKLMSVINKSHAFIYLKGIDGRYLLVNERYEKYFNVSNKDIMGKLDHELHPQGVANHLSKNDKTVLSNNNPVQYMETLASEKGSCKRITIKFPLFDSRGMPHAICGISTDINDNNAS